jgi:predicted ribosome quality control (RQC) complex YloA/Tae2 family protein
VENQVSDFAHKVNRLKTTIKRRVKTLKKALSKAQEQLSSCKNWQVLHHAAELFQANMYKIKRGDKQLITEDWENEGALVIITLDPKMKPFEDVAKRFKKAQKFKKGLPFAIVEVERNAKALETAIQILSALENVKTEEELTALKEQQSLPKPQEKPKKGIKAPVKPYIEYRSDSGICIWVGKTANMNDQLTFRYANGNDPWLHVAEYPGSHVVIHPESNQKVDDATLQKAMQLALYHSKARRFKEGEVIVTQTKYVRRFGKEKGKVQIANEKRYFIRLKE